MKGGSSPSPALQPIENCDLAQAHGGPRDARRTTAKPEVKRHLPQSKGWDRLTEGLKNVSENVPIFETEVARVVQGYVSGRSHHTTMLSTRHALQELV